MKIKLKIWRQVNSESKGSFKNYTLDKISEDMSFLEMLDLLNNNLISKDEEPIAFDHDCREGICGTCGV
ncbi:2Fe-2S iron-sulfur cluster-binding protein, partial [Candidatus Marinimicrobia bacterium]|nr:2Fe-2S iron-sulfur cluster-binding protein [Candidatus Neomarinimicrobiota bacterium]